MTQQTIRQVHGIDEQLTRSVAPARGQQVRDVGSRWGSSASAIKLGLHSVRTSDSSTISAMEREPAVTVNEQAGKRRKRARQVHGVSVDK